MLIVRHGLRSKTKRKSECPLPPQVAPSKSPMTESRSCARATIALMPDPEELVTPELTDAERYVLNRGLVEWGGPAHCTEAMAIAMGFRSVGDLFVQADRMIDALEQGRPLSRRDWTRALLATEIVFVSDVLGSGQEWPITTGLDDVETLRTLRGLQIKLAAVIVRRGAWT